MIRIRGITTRMTIMIMIIVLIRKLVWTIHPELRTSEPNSKQAPRSLTRI